MIQSKSGEHPTSELEIEIHVGHVVLQRRRGIATVDLTMEGTLVSVRRYKGTESHMEMDGNSSLCT